jgi:hypothetical protein
MASRRKMLIEILNYGGFISGDSVSYLQCRGQLGGGEWATLHTQQKHYCRE